MQESLLKTIEAVVAAYGLKALPGSDGEVTVLEKVQDMCKTYKNGDSLEFTATVNCAFDPEKADQLAALTGEKATDDGDAASTEETSETEESEATEEAAVE